MKTEDYLGDGVYASFDGYHIVLDLRAQDNTTRIALEPAVMHALEQFRKRVYADDREANSSIDGYQKSKEV